MYEYPILKTRKNIKALTCIDNSEPNINYMTHYIKLKSYYRLNKNSCTYRKLKFTSYKLRKKYLLKDRGCNISFINCGHGDACLIENRGKYALIDFGDKEQAVDKFLKENVKGDTIDYAICTHIHGDHMADFENVLSSYKVNNFITVKNINNKNVKQSQKEIVKIENCCNASTLIMLEIGNCLENHSHNFKLGNAEFEFLGPIEDLDNLNDNSIILKMNYKDVSVLFTGDISHTAEKKIIKWCDENGKDLKSKIIKIAHHGSEKSSCKMFLNEVQPETAVISCGEKNRYCHPDKELIDRLNDYCYNTFLTYTDKSIDFHITPTGKVLQPFNKSLLYQNIYNNNEIYMS